MGRADRGSPGPLSLSLSRRPNEGGDGRGGAKRGRIDRAFFFPLSRGFRCGWLPGSGRAANQRTAKPSESGSSAPCRQQRQSPPIASKLRKIAFSLRSIPPRSPPAKSVSATVSRKCGTAIVEPRCARMQDRRSNTADLVILLRGVTICEPDTRPARHRQLARNPLLQKKKSCRDDAFGAQNHDVVHQWRHGVALDGRCGEPSSHVADAAQGAAARGGGGGGPQWDGNGNPASAPSPMESV